MRELSLGKSFCQFCHFLIYISVRFVYISVTFPFHPLFSCLLAKIHAMPFLPCHPCHVWHLIDFKRFFLAKTLAKTCHACPQNAKLLIFKGFFIVKRVMSLIYRVLLQIVIMPHCLLACLCCLLVLLACVLLAHAMLLYITMQQAMLLYITM